MANQSNRSRSLLSKGGCLFTEAELADDLTVSINVFAVEVIEKTAALTDHFQQAASTAVVLLVLA